ncbi:hypothetical protein Hypma_009079 [Hypsizygus marmoreus]|uniref:Uncharacterized protein n=1 Tax=Hypsizygus marmoreus TaxID=39966 RepID=A0A369JR51_HYPMA|nr:hypothetical protein Hypma_009079 [Hypsizygus marmoreus]
MFRTGSPYSPFFTSGLLSEPQPCSPEEESSRSASLDPPLGPRRGSLPTDSPARSPSSTDGSSAFYFTLQPKRDTQEFRSFLSLDLAESNSLRSASLKRKASSRAEKSFTMFSQIPEVTFNTRLAPPPRTSVRLRLSRDSLRTIPSPKPAPSMTLPAVPVPKHQTTPSSSSSIPSTPPRLPSIAISPSLGLTLERASQSAPSLIISRTTAPSLVYALPPKRESTSSVSTRARKVNRSHALARLEGRSNSTRHKPMAKPIERNFMSMSDDEDDSDLEAEPPRITLSAVLEPEDVVLPPPSAVRLQGSRSAPISGSFPSLTTSRSSSSRKRRTSKEWFPLKSFIDLQSDEEMSGWSWRSFIEVASVS